MEHLEIDNTESCILKITKWAKKHTGHWETEENIKAQQDKAS